MAGIPRHQGRADPKIGPSDSSDTYSDRPDLGSEGGTDTDSGGTGERKTVGKVPNARDLKTDRVAEDKDVGLGGGLDQAEEGRLGTTDEELARKPKP